MKGKNVCIYLSSKRLELLGSEPAKRIYQLIDGLSPLDAVTSKFVTVIPSAEKVEHSEPMKVCPSCKEWNPVARLRCVKCNERF